MPLIPARLTEHTCSPTDRWVLVLWHELVRFSHLVILTTVYFRTAELILKHLHAWDLCQNCHSEYLEYLSLSSVFVNLGQVLSWQHMTVDFTRTPQLRCPVHLGSEWLVLLLLQTFFKLLLFCCPSRRIFYSSCWKDSNVWESFFYSFPISFPEQPFLYCLRSASFFLPSLTFAFSTSLFWLFCHRHPHPWGLSKVTCVTHQDDPHSQQLSRLGDMTSVSSPSSCIKEIQLSPTAGNASPARRAHVIPWLSFYENVRDWKICRVIFSTVRRYLHRDLSFLALSIWTLYPCLR